MTVCLLGCSQTESFGVTSNVDNSVTVMTENAKTGSYAIGYITIEENEKLCVESKLTEDSKVQIDIIDSEIDEATHQSKIVKTFFVQAEENKEFALDKGEYTIKAFVLQTATGTVDLFARPADM